MASTISKKTFTYDGQQNFSEFTLSAEETHVEFIYKDILSRCIRYESHETVCMETRRGQICEKRPYLKKVCKETSEGTICNKVPYTREIPYTCYKKVRVPHVIKDFDVDANVKIVVENGPHSQASEEFKVELEGDKISFFAKGSKKYFLILKSEESLPKISGKYKFLDVTYRVELIEAEPILTAIDVKDISFENNILNFLTGPISHFEHLEVSLEVKNGKGLFPMTLFKKAIDFENMNITKSASSTYFSIDFNQIGLHLQPGRNKITTKVYFNPKGKFLNSFQFYNKTNDSDSIVVKKKR